MGAGRRAYWWERVLHAIPGVTKRCPGGNQHLPWSRVCFCCHGDGGWSGYGAFIRFGRTWYAIPGHVIPVNSERP